MKYLPLILLLLTSQASAEESIRWMQPDYEPGDTFEYRVVSVEVVPEWQTLEELWKVGEIRGAVVDPLVSMTVEARTTRDGVTGPVSEEHVYVPEPGGVALLAGLGLLGWMRAAREKE